MDYTSPTFYFFLCVAFMGQSTKKNIHNISGSFKHFLDLLFKLFFVVFVERNSEVKDNLYFSAERGCK